MQGLAVWAERSNPCVFNYFEQHALAILNKEADLRNVFDQYSQLENRVSHALLTALNLDRKLLSLFLSDFLKVRPPVEAKKLSIFEQTYPGQDEKSEETNANASQGVPDGWICSETERWCLIIESKVQAKLSDNQLQRHQYTARNRGFEKVIVVAITSRDEIVPLGSVIWKQWSEVYAWLSRRAHQHEWARQVTDYLETIETSRDQRGHQFEGTLTMFDGIPFNDENPYRYEQAKRLLRLAIAELRSRKDLKGRLDIGADHQGRGSITGKNSNHVWDFISLRVANADVPHTKYPHLTFGIGDTHVDVMITVPNAVNSIMKANIGALEKMGYAALVEEICKNLALLLRKVPGAVPTFRGVQRRYSSQRAVPYIDALIEFDLRTALHSLKGPKFTPIWLDAAYEAWTNKSGMNYQFQIGVKFPYRTCTKALGDKNCLNLFAEVWLACLPLLDLAKSEM